MIYSVEREVDGGMGKSVSEQTHIKFGLLAYLYFLKIYQDYAKWIN